MAPISSPHEGRAQALLAATVLFLILPFPFVALRFWARRLKQLPLCFNDYMILLGLLFSTGYNVNILIASILGGYGQHIFNLSLSEIEVNSKSAVASTMLWPTANTCIKISVLHFYKKIFFSKRTAYAIYAVGTLVICYWLSTVITALSICQPFNFNWDIAIEGHCGNRVQYYLATAILNLLIDVMIVALPLPLLWGLQMKTSRKVSLTVIFSLGGLICIISIIRCIAIAKLNLLDETYDIVLDNICTSLEPTLGVINACLPLMQPIASKVNGSQVFTWFKTLGTVGTSQRRLTGTNSKEFPGSDDFQRLPADLYPLTTISAAGGSQRRSTKDNSGGESILTGSV